MPKIWKNLCKARTANDKLKSDIYGVQLDLNGKSDALHLRVDSVDKHVKKNKEEIGLQEGKEIFELVRVIWGTIKYSRFGQ